MFQLVVLQTSTTLKRIGSAYKNKGVQAITQGLGQWQFCLGRVPIRPLFGGNKRWHMLAPIFGLCIWWCRICWMAFAATCAVLRGPFPIQKNYPLLGLWGLLPWTRRTWIGPSDGRICHCIAIRKGMLDRSSRVLVATAAILANHMRKMHGIGGDITNFCESAHIG